MNLLTIADYISTFPLSFYFTTIYIIISDLKNIEQQTEYPILLLGLIISSLIVKFFKSIDIKKDFIYRPKQASYCDYLSKNKNSKIMGFPSGHMSSTALFATFMILLRFYKKYQKPNNSLQEQKKNNQTLIEEFIKNDYLHIIINLLLIILVGWARYYKYCHTSLQIIVGTILGIILGIIFFIMFQKIDQKINNNQKQ